MTHQDMFDIAVRGILAQGGPSAIIDSKGEAMCQYRHPNGRKCAAGWLMADDYYKPDFENRGAKFVLKNAGEFDHADLAFIERLQEIHDTAALSAADMTVIVGDAEFFKSWAPRMIDFALTKGLKVPKELSDA